MLRRLGTLILPSALPAAVLIAGLTLLPGCDEPGPRAPLPTPPSPQPFGLDPAKQDKQFKNSNDLNRHADNDRERLVAQFNESRKRQEEQRKLEAEKKGQKDKHAAPGDNGSGSAAGIRAPKGVTVFGSKAFEKKEERIPFAAAEKDSKNPKWMESGSREVIPRSTEETAPKKGWLQRLFGGAQNDAPESKVTGEVLAGEKMGLGPSALKSAEGAFHRQTSKPVYDMLRTAPLDRKDSVLKQVQEVIAAKRLEAQNAQADAGGKRTAKASAEEPRAEIVDVGPRTDAAAGAPAGAPLEASDSAPADYKQIAEQQYQAALVSRDLVAREAAFEKAAVERREDALAPLVAELRAGGNLSGMAARCLAVIGIPSPEAEDALLQGFARRDAVVRLACAEALGKLKCRRAAAPLGETLKTEKNWQCRCAEAEALGLTGERDAIPVLKACVADSGELEFVKARAALALARLGDRTGRSYLASIVRSPQPALQLTGLAGLVELNDLDSAGYLNAALESAYEEVWTTAVVLFARIGPESALPVLRRRFDSEFDILRRRAALAMGYLGCDEGVAYIRKSLEAEPVQERAMACELLASLGRTDCIPLLIERLQDPHTGVRQNAALALARLNATEALPALVAASRSIGNSGQLPPALRGAGPNMEERLAMLAAIRALRGEKSELVLKTRPKKDSAIWPEVDQMLNEQQVEYLKLYQVVDVVADDQQRAMGAILRQPNGKEVLFREGENVAGGYCVRDIGLASKRENAVSPAYVKLMRGDEAVILVDGQPAQVEKSKRKSE